jgi:hypothetical protein
VRKELTAAKVSTRKILLQGPANTTCEISAADDPNSSFKVDTDDNGIIRINVTATDESSLRPDLSLDCPTQGAASKKRRINPGEIDALQPKLQSIAANPSPHAFFRPPLTSDPKAMTQAELIAAGYPPRPDATESQEEYDRWLTHIARPAMIVPAHLIAHAEHKFTSVTPQNSTAWDGFALTGASSPYIDVRAHIWAPQAANGTVGTASSWVGLGGINTNSLVQAGLLSWQSAFVQSGHLVYYSGSGAWVEWFPANVSAISNFTVNQGDEVLVFLVGRGCSRKRDALRKLFVDVHVQRRN